MTVKGIKACPVCKGQKKGCGQDPKTLAIFCKSAYSESQDFTFVGVANSSFNIYKYTPTSISTSDINHAKLDFTSSNTSILFVPSKVNPFMHKLTENYDTVFNQHSNIQDTAKLIKHKLNHLPEPHQLVTQYKFSLIRNNSLINPSLREVYSELGIRTKNNHFYSKRGDYVIVPAYNADNQIWGLLNWNFTCLEDKYTWSSPYILGENKTHTLEGHLPIQVLLQTKEAPLIFCEGIAKPIYSKYLLESVGYKAHFIGFSTAFEGYKDTVIELLDRLYKQRKLTNKIYLAPDYGWQQNNLVKTNYENLALILKSVGLDLDIVLWQDPKDLDEINPSYFLSSQTENFLDYLDGKTTNQHYITNCGVKPGYPGKFIPEFKPFLSFNKSTYSVEEIKEIYSNSDRIIVDKRPPGVGKTYTAGLLELKDFANKFTRIIYLTQQPDLPSTSTIRDNFTRLPIRTNQIWVSPDGFELSYKHYPGYEPYNPGNCAHSNLFSSVSKSLNKRICNNCKYSNYCSKEEGDNYGFKYVRKEAYLQTKLRMHVNSLRSEEGLTEDLLKNWVIVIDELNKSYPIIQVKEYTKLEVQNYKNQFKSVTMPYYRLEELDTIFDLLFNTLEDKKDTPYGENLKLDFSCYEETLNFLVSYYESLLLTELPGIELNLEFLDFLSTPNLIASFHKETVKLYKRDKFLTDLIKFAGRVIVLDATLSDEMIRLLFNLSKEERITTIESRDTTPDNTNITVFTQTSNINNRSNKNKVRELKEAVRDYLENLGYTDVGFISPKNNSDEGELHHFTTGRGSNLYSSKSCVVSMGVPIPNITGFNAYLLACNPTLTPSKLSYLLNESVGSEIIQEIGRLRSNRRSEETLDYYFVGNLNLCNLSKFGYKVRYLTLSLSSRAKVLDYSNVLSKTAYLDITKIPGIEFEDILTYYDILEKALSREIDFISSAVLPEQFISRVRGVRSTHHHQWSEIDKKLTSSCISPILFDTNFNMQDRINFVNEYLNYVKNRRHSRK